MMSDMSTNPGTNPSKNPGTNPGDRSVNQLEREVDLERAKVADTIDALQEKVSVNHIVDTVMAAISKNGGEISRNLGRTVRDNPVPLILTGVGLAWLMASSGRDERASAYAGDWDRDDAWDRADAGGWTGEDDDLPVTPLYGENPYVAGSADDGYATGRARYPAGDDEFASESDKPSMGERLRDAGDAVAERGSELAGAARDALSQGRRQVRGGLHSAGDRMRSTAGGTREWGNRNAHAAQDSIYSAIEDHPLVMGALALAVGAALGSAMPRTRTEDDLMGAQADRAKRSARTMVEAEADKAMAVAGAVADEGRKIAGEAGEEIDRHASSGDAMVDQASDKARETAERLRKAGETEAAKQDLGTGKPAS